MAGGFGGLFPDDRKERTVGFPSRDRHEPDPGQGPGMVRPRIFGGRIRPPLPRSDPRPPHGDRCKGPLPRSPLLPSPLIVPGGEYRFYTEGFPRTRKGRDLAGERGPRGVAHKTPTRGREGGGRD